MKFFVFLCDYPFLFAVNSVSVLVIPGFISLLVFREFLLVRHCFANPIADALFWSLWSSSLSFDTCFSINYCILLYFAYVILAQLFSFLLFF